MSRRESGVGGVRGGGGGGGVGGGGEKERGGMGWGGGGGGGGGGVRSTNFNLLRKIKAYTINNCYFFKVNAFLSSAVIMITRHGNRNPTNATDEATDHATGEAVGAEGLPSATNSGNTFFRIC